MIDVKEDIDVYKPCSMLGWCPYGPLVEDFPLKEKPDDVSCGIYGHDCPAFTRAEPFVDNKHKTSVMSQDEVNKIFEDAALGRLSKKTKKKK